jgi:hypothetical protein
MVASSTGQSPTIFLEVYTDFESGTVTTRAIENPSFPTTYVSCAMDRRVVYPSGLLYDVDRQVNGNVTFTGACNVVDSSAVHSAMDASAQLVYDAMSHTTIYEFKFDGSAFPKRIPVSMSRIASSVSVSPSVAELAMALAAYPLSMPPIGCSDLRITRHEEARAAVSERLALAVSSVLGSAMLSTLMINLVLASDGPVMDTTAGEHVLSVDVVTPFDVALRIHGMTLEQEHHAVEVVSFDLVVKY